MGAAERFVSTVEYPIDVSDTGDDRFKRLQYKIHNFTLASFWTPFLVKAKEHDPDDTIGAGLFSLYLDELDESWTTKIDEFDYLIVSDGHWFFRRLIYRHNGRPIGCHSCMVQNLTDYPAPYGYRLAFRTAFRAIISRENFKGITYLRTFSPAHFDGGAWDGGGNCMRKRPFESNEAILEGVYLDMYNAQIEEFRAAEKEGREG
ncbi:hypothetical protein Nepgr_029016 [Nepenthes gracilis]|uniref:Trichome birefringence-like C-terminal domain-containing protein n=1 Tax=Nepenthes gracilis TaxID=150966 RepID=A0AAD3TDG8_NEPGR|nr:hypothetical protein Nepgr_029016 [Nepenthes gracilis]